MIESGGALYEDGHQWCEPELTAHYQQPIPPAGYADHHLASERAQGCVHDLVGRHPKPVRYVLGDMQRPEFGTVVDARASESGAQHLDAHTGGAQLEVERPGEADQKGLGPRVRDVAARRNEAADGRNVDDRAMSSREHVRQNGSAQPHGASTCTWSMARCCTAVTVTNEPAVTKPAALTRKLTSGSAAMRAHRRSTCLASATSVWKTSARAPQRASTSAASASSRSARRATRTRACPSPASRRANAAPIPLEAPVITAVDTGHLASVGIGVRAGHAGARTASGGWERRHEANPFEDAYQHSGV